MFLRSVAGADQQVVEDSLRLHLGHPGRLSHRVRARLLRSAGGRQRRGVRPGWGPRRPPAAQLEGGQHDTAAAHQEAQEDEGDQGETDQKVQNLPSVGSHVDRHCVLGLPEVRAFVLLEEKIKNSC